MMTINGLVGLLSSQATREITLSCGLSLVFRKTLVEDISQIEDHILSKRSTLNIQEMEEELKKTQNKEIKQAILDGLRDGIKEQVQKPAFALFGEDIDFQLSAHGKAYSMWLLSHKEDDTVQDYIRLYASCNEEDFQKIDEILDWSRELKYLGK